MILLARGTNRSQLFLYLP